MKTLLVTALAFWSAGAMAATESEKTLFEISSPQVTKFAAEVQAENQASAVKSVLAILENDRPAVKAWSVNTEGRDLKAEESSATKTL